MGRRPVLSLAALGLGAWLTLFMASCIYTPGRRLTPAGSISRAGDLTGVYCFESEAANLGRYSASDHAVIPFFAAWQLREQSTVQATQDGTSVSFAIAAPGETEQKQRYDFAAQGGRIESGVLVVTPSQSPSPFGWYRTRRRSTMFKLDDGSLVMTDQHTYTGLACALVPTHERSEAVLTLRPGACGGPMVTKRASKARDRDSRAERIGSRPENPAPRATDPAPKAED